MITLPKLAVAFLLGASLLGCTGSEGSNEDPKASTTSVAKDPGQLPQDMSPQARKSAESAMAQHEAMNAEMEKQGEAMRKAQAAAHGN